MATPPPVKDVVPPKPTKSRRQSNGNGNLTNYQRKVICEFYRKSGGVMSQKDLAQWTKHEFGLKKTPAQSTISGILRRQHEFINMSSLELGIKKRRVEEEEVLMDTELEHLMLFLRLSNPVPMMEYLNDETMSDYPVHEDKFDVVSSVCEVPEDEVDESIEESPGRTLSLQEKLKAFRDVLHVLKDRSDADDSALNAIRRVQDAIRMEGQKEAMGALGSSGDTKSVFDLDTAVGADSSNGSTSMTSLEVDSQQHMDASSLLDSTESSALSAASASLAEGAGDHTSSMLSGAADEDRPHVNESFHAVI
ncbi:hypothetical protein PC129_g8667 [Phytophthora cactorum]|uniref:ARS-binding protein 1 N-terminal domain-containing protein n=1 Tax=Phytophthora cactorum TaxID=29920 RepID=A0A8T1CCC8_9STRA|nr:hypothetical protein PC113_g11273 [Phytophthora cactorum]KAG2904698.1 hypothetical protein PC114_g11794 [Phytophthora cactorum]KAG2919787.1 hypothetical protein PC115_g10026 [Phytophthora cactorum]KAG2938107.1 hypothetical protein PC117_g11412 [Phytophthora cactorum]KAG3220577.1 hypothetical protein PC129_g8667 [Phytophthora cactorum]